MMDQEPVTGGCHYSFGCEEVSAAMRQLPLLDRPKANDLLPLQVFLRKREFSWRLADHLRRSHFLGREAYWQ